TAVVLGDRFLEARRYFGRRLRAYSRALRSATVFRELQLELVGEIDELLELGFDELRVAGDAAAQRFGELAHGTQLFLRKTLRSQLVAARQEILRRIVELVAHVVDAPRVVPEAAIARIPDAA